MNEAYSAMMSLPAQQRQSLVLMASLLSLMRDEAARRGRLSLLQIR